MKVLVINAGSSSLKYQFIDMENEAVLAKGLCERIGIDGKIIHKTADGKAFEEQISFPTHAEAFEKVLAMLTSGETKVIGDIKEISAVGHRVVQGGEKFTKSAVIDDELLAAVESVSDLAPLHNPANVLAIRACQKVLGKDVPQVAVFDTAFHQTMPAKAYTFAIPYEYYEKYHVRRYGFHGTSHKFVANRCAEIMGKKLEDLKIITCHLGNGSSITAVDQGKSVDTTMGFTPVDGIMMGTRAGSIDPSILTYIAEKEGKTTKELNDIINKKSGFQGVSEKTSDFRDIIADALNGDKKCALAQEMFSYQLKKYIGSFAAAMGGVDAVVFTGGIGENSFEARIESTEGLEFMGIEVDATLNKEKNRTEAEISKVSSKVKVFIIPTNEELAIARDTKALAK